MRYNALHGRRTLRRHLAARPRPQEVRTQLTETVGQQAPKASCPNELVAEKGATTRCSMEFPEGELGISVEVTSAKDGDAKLAIEADDEVKPKS
jgi:hypothetical protein